MKKLFIATSSFGQYDQRPLELLKKLKIKYTLNPLSRKLSKTELIEHAQEYDHILAGTEKYDENVFLNLPKLKYIFRLGTGIDNINISIAKQKKIKVTSSKITPEKAVAELVVGMILTLLRKINAQDQNLKRNIWKKEMGFLLHKKTVGIIGYGKIGKYLKKILRGFGVNVIVHDIKKIKLIKNYSLKYLISQSDIVTVHANYTKKNKKLLDSKILNKLKKNSVLINTSRAEIIDYECLYKLLKNKKILGAALDVFEKEPYQGKFQKLNNVILTPHIGSYAREIRSEMELEAAKVISKIILK